MESYAQPEYIRQDPSVEEKDWLHTGARKNKPRANHVAMNGKRVKVGEEFELDGADGKTHHPMCPRDIRLPASETVNCHCIMRPIRNKEIMGMSVEERRALRKKYMDEVDAEWDIAHATDKVDMIKSMKREDQIKYFGGQDGGKQRMALIDSGVISTDKELERLYKIDVDGKRVRKSLQELTEDGIFTVSDATLSHSMVGDYILPSKEYPNGRLPKGGHSQASMDTMDEKGITYHVTKTYTNGVRIGFVDNHKSGLKNGKITKSYPDADIGQAWFPKNWSEDSVRNAGTYVANKGIGTGFIKFAEYKGVKVGIFVDANRNPTTIFPDNMNQPKIHGAIEGARD